ncbi:flagellar basal body-associated FliL family protein [Oleidesulfovibrio sp.]|uniref:flagellar basal body-associated FliL family protein n=1 Tax=Oleidesulfovibrio sp. TaxID=2909707 RepID=UPI003A84134F
MLLMVDDDPLGGEAGDSTQLDTEELQPVDLSGGGSEEKVELDLEDAPFLMDDDEEEEEAAEEESSAGSLDLDTGAASRKKAGFNAAALFRNRKVQIGAGAVLLLLIGLLTFLLWPSGDAEDSSVSQPVAKKKVVRKVGEEPPKKEEEPKKPEFVVAWEPFWVEQTDAEGKIRFLVCKFAAVTENERLSWEVGTKKVVLRDAIFYYLRNKSLLFLSDESNVDTLKTDLLAVVNQYLDNGQLQDLLIENYLVK